MRIAHFPPAVLLAVLSLPAWGAPPPPADPATPVTPTAPAAQESFKVVVTAQDAAILSGAGKAYYPVGHMGLGSVLEVVDASYPGYLEILPPGCCAAFVAKDKVQADAKGAIATVSTDGTDCLAAGLEMTPDKSFRLMRKLAKGETLEILGVVGDYYRVEAPSKTTVFVAGDQVRKATEKDLKDGPPEAEPGFKIAAGSPKNDPKTPEVKGLKPKVATAKPDKAPEQTPEKPAKVDDGIDSPATDPALRAAEGRRNEAYAAAKEAPVPSAKLTLLLAEYTALAKRQDFNAVDGQLAAGRVAQLTRDLTISQNLEKVAAAEQAGIDAGKPPVTAPQIGYDAVGQLKVSTIYNGTTLPKLYRLADPTTDALVAYVLPESVDGAMLNKLVGIQGDIEMDPNLKVRVIRVKKVEALTANGKK